MRVACVAFACVCALMSVLMGSAEARIRLNDSELLAGLALRRLPAVTSESPRATRNAGFLTFPAVTPSLGLLTSSQQVICAQQRIKQEPETHFHHPPISGSPSKVHIAVLICARQPYFRTIDAR